MTVTMDCLECDAPVTFVTDNPEDPDGPICDKCCAEMGIQET